MKKASIEEKKNKAIELLHKLDVYKPYIEGLRKKTRFAFTKTSAAIGCTKSRK